MRWLHVYDGQSREAYQLIINGQHVGAIWDPPAPDKKWGHFCYLHGDNQGTQLADTKQEAMDALVARVVAVRMGG